MACRQVGDKKQDPGMGPCGGGSEGSRECGFLGLGCRHGFVLNGLGGRRLDGAIGGIRILGRRSVLGNGRRNWWSLISDGRVASWQGITTAACAIASAMVDVSGFTRCSASSWLCYHATYYCFLETKKAT